MLKIGEFSKLSMIWAKKFRRKGNLSADIFVVEFTLRCKEAEQPVWRV